MDNKYGTPEGRVFFIQGSYYGTLPGKAPAAAQIELSWIEYNGEVAECKITFDHAPEVRFSIMRDDLFRAAYSSLPRDYKCHWGTIDLQASGDLFGVYLTNAAGATHAFGFPLTVVKEFLRQIEAIKPINQPLDDAAWDAFMYVCEMTDG